MSSVYHDGEKYIQEQMGVTAKANSLSSMIHNDIPIAAAQFLATLDFCVITFSINNKELHNSIVFGFESFIKILNTKEMLIDLENKSFIPKDIYENEKISIGFIGLDFENRMRIRINGTGKIEDNKLHLYINEVYSNCPKYINDRETIGKLDFLNDSNLTKYTTLENDCKKILSHADTFFLSSIHENNGADISHKGGEKGFLRVISPKILEFEDFQGNNMYNTLGNIHINPNVSIILIDFTSNDILHITGIATIKQDFESGTKKLKVQIKCKSISIESNSFSLKYNK